MPASIHKADLMLFEHLDMQAQFIGLPAPNAGAIDQFRSGRRCGRVSTASNWESFIRPGTRQEARRFT